MKDFLGNRINENHQLGYENIIVLMDTMNSDDTNRSISYVPKEDGIFILGCNYRQQSFANLVDDDANIRIASVSSAQSNAGENRIQVLAHRNKNYRIYGVRVFARYIPYK